MEIVKILVFYSMDRNQELIGIILAAGASRRLGSPKQLLNINGKALINHTLDIALASEVKDWLLVLGANKEKILQELDQHSTDLCIFEGWEKGMGASLSASIRFLKGKGISTEAYLFLVCDQPYLTKEYINLLVKSWRKHKTIIASTYKSKPSVPAVIPSDYEAQLIRLQGDKGARDILRQNEGRLLNFEAGAHDLDTQEDYKKYLNKPR